MSRSARFTTRRRVTVVGEDGATPFWLEHIGAIIVVGLVALAGAIAVLSSTEWGRFAMVWLGLGLGAAVTAALATVPVRSIRAREPAVAWVGKTLSALGWGGVAVVMLSGIPHALWRGFDDLSDSEHALPGIMVLLFTGIAILGMWLESCRPLPALDRTPRAARVIVNADDSEGGQILTLRYRGADGAEHDAELADRILDISRDRFAPGTTWQVYAFRDPALAGIVVFLTEAHDEVWRQGYKLDGVRLGGESGPVRPGPGSPFLREGSRWEFET